jgi:hypothetical protein
MAADAKANEAFLTLRGKFIRQGRTTQQHLPARHTRPL